MTMLVLNPITSWIWPGFLLKEMIKSHESGHLELASSHLFFVLESGDEEGGRQRRTKK